MTNGGRDVAVIRARCLRCDNLVELPANYCAQCRKDLRKGHPSRALPKVLGFLLLLAVMTFAVLHFGNVVDSGGLFKG